MKRLHLLFMTFHFLLAALVLLVNFKHVTIGGQAGTEFRCGI